MTDATVPPLTRISVPDGLPRGTRSQDEMRDRCDARQRLATKPERGDPLEIVGTTDLARCVPLDREPRVVSLHAFPVVFDANQLLPAELRRDRDAAGSRVDRVLDQFLDDGGRALHHLAGGDLIGEVRRKSMNATHQIQPINRNNRSIPPDIAAMAPDTHQNCACSPPGNCGSGTFIPHMPVSTVSGMKMVDATVKHLHDLIEAVRHRGQIRLQDAR
jgi:hypothetical protein